MTKYWIKLYHEILHDPKMATLDADTWRLAIECFLMAGEVGDDGYLPSLKHMAWTLRRGEEQLEMMLDELIQIEVIEMRDGKYYVRKFRERQDPLPKADYNRRRREEVVTDKYYQPVTVGNTEPDTDIDTDIDAESDSTTGNAQTPEKQPNIFRFYEQNIGVLTPIIADRLKEAEQDYPADWLPEAFKVAIENNARNWAYVHAILERWRIDGFKVDKRQPGRNGGKKLAAVDRTSDSARNRYAEE